MLRRFDDLQQAWGAQSNFIIREFLFGVNVSAISSQPSLQTNIRHAWPMRPRSTPRKVLSKGEWAKHFLSGSMLPLIASLAQVQELSGQDSSQARVSRGAARSASSSIFEAASAFF